MSFPSAHMGDQKKGYKCAVCRAESHRAVGGRPGYETSHARHCHDTGLLHDRVQRLEERIEELETK